MKKEVSDNNISLPHATLIIHLNTNGIVNSEQRFVVTILSHLFLRSSVAVVRQLINDDCNSLLFFNKS